jgi:hypothetical protein
MDRQTVGRSQTVRLHYCWVSSFQFPVLTITATIMAVVFLGYGVSLVLFVLALRGLGTARTGAYFSTAPFIGALVALVVFKESTTPAFWLACPLMGWGVWLHLTEHHEHVHTHQLMVINMSMISSGSPRNPAAIAICTTIQW